MSSNKAGSRRDEPVPWLLTTTVVEVGSPNSAHPSLRPFGTSISCSRMLGVCPLLHRRAQISTCALRGCAALRQMGLGFTVHRALVVDPYRDGRAGLAFLADLTVGTRGR